MFTEFLYRLWTNADYTSPITVINYACQKCFSELTCFKNSNNENEKQG